MKETRNIKYELSAITILSAAGTAYYLYADTEPSFLLALILISYIIGIVSITLRPMVNKRENRRNISVLCFGVTAGLCYGAALAILTDITESLDIIMVVIGILGWAAAGGLFAVLSAYIISFNFIKDFRSALSHKKHNVHCSRGSTSKQKR